MSKNLMLSAGRPSEKRERTATLASLADQKETKRVNFDLSVEQHTKLKIFAAKKGVTVKQLLTEFVESLRID